MTWLLLSVPAGPPTVRPRNQKVAVRKFKKSPASFAPATSYVERDLVEAEPASALDSEKGQA